MIEFPHGEMRITGGTARGKKLRMPPRGGVRPTSELVRGAIFSILTPEGLEGARVLDLYAGTGALGIEALSRGAAWADFVEQNPRMCAIIRANLEETGLSGRARILPTTVERALTILEGPYHFIFMDPPYSLPSLDPILEALAGAGLLAPEGVLVVEHSRHLKLKASYDGVAIFKSRRYGDTVVEFLRKGGPQW